MNLFDGRTMARLAQSRARLETHGNVDGGARGSVRGPQGSTTAIGDTAAGPSAPPDRPLQAIEGPTSKNYPVGSLRWLEGPDLYRVSSPGDPNYAAAKFLATQAWCHVCKNWEALYPELDSAVVDTQVG